MMPPLEADNQRRVGRAMLEDVGDGSPCDYTRSRPPYSTADSGCTLGWHQRDDGGAIEREVALEHVLQHLRSHGVNPVISSQNIRRIAAEQVYGIEAAQPISVLLQRRLVIAARRLLGAV